MSNTWRKLKNSFLSYQRSDRNAIIIIGSLILLVFSFNFVLKNTPPKSNSDFGEIKALIELWERAKSEKQNATSLFNFDPNLISVEDLDSLSIPNNIKRNLVNYRKAGGKFKTVADVRKIYGMNDSIFATIQNYIQVRATKKVKIKSKVRTMVKPTGHFNPNTANLSNLKYFGLNNYQANNLINYRNKGGHYTVPSDVMKIYGIDSTFFIQIEEFIEIPVEEKELIILPAESILVELNSADSLDLVQLNGIGPSYAKRIVKFRTLLGGFYCKEQIKEVYNFPEETFFKIQSNIYVDTLAIKKLRINFLEYGELLKHPYLGKNEVNLILKFRETNGSFQNVSEVQGIEGFDADMYRRVNSYLTCR